MAALSVTALQMFIIRLLERKEFKLNSAGMSFGYFQLIKYKEL